MRFVIVASPRTGSSHLADLLNHQADILCNGEVFHPRRAFVSWPNVDKKLRKSLTAQRDRDPVAFLKCIFDENFGKSHVGFKIFSNHNDEVINIVINDKNTLKIILYRSNVLAIYSSAYLARQSGKWDIRKEGKKEEIDKALFERGKFIKFYNKYVGFYRSVLGEISSKSQPFQIVRYEEINDPSVFAALVSSIGADAANVRIESAHTKQNPANILSRFSNPEEVGAFLSEFHLEHWTHEGMLSLDRLPDSRG